MGDDAYAIEAFGTFGETKSSGQPAPYAARRGDRFHLCYVRGGQLRCYKFSVLRYLMSASATSAVGRHPGAFASAVSVRPPIASIGKEHPTLRVSVTRPGLAPP